MLERLLYSKNTEEIWKHTHNHNTLLFHILNNTKRETQKETLLQDDNNDNNNIK